jgi:sigma-B regulation protein RsbU (phosphoserine phosphatase)
LKCQSRDEKELSIAADIQAKLLPQEIPENEDIQMAASNIMARSVGGDYYGFMANESGQLAVIVADSMGKGISGALLMTTARAIWRSISPSELATPGKVLSMINHAIYDDMQLTQAFVTMFVAFYDPDNSTLHYSSAGHNPALFHTPKAVYCRELDVGGPPIGLFPNSEFPSEELPLNSGDLIAIYTDGIVEAVNDKKELFGVERFCNIIYKNRDLDVERIREKILAGLNSYTMDIPQSDDITMVIMRRR